MFFFNRRDDALLDRLTSEVRNRQPRLGRTDIDAGHEPVTRVELHERGTAAAARRRSAEILDDAASDQIRAERSDGRRRQPGGGDDLGARERRGLRDREGEDPIEVERPKMSRVACADIHVDLTLRHAGRVACHTFENSL